MIFAHTLEKILSGDKWQTRRLVKPNEELNLSDSTKRVQQNGKRTVYQVGKSYAVQPNRGKKAVARILLTGLRKETVNDINADDAIAEGFLSRDEFLNTWITIHGSKADMQCEVWVLEFKLQVLITNELKGLYEQYLSKNRDIDNCYDVSPAITRVSGTGLHSGHYKIG